MNNFYLLVIGGFLFTTQSCKSIKHIQSASVNSECLTFFLNMVEPIKRKNKNYFVFNIRDDAQSKKSLYIDYSTEVMWGLDNKRSECLEYFTKKDIKKILGKPNKLRSKELEWYYVFDFGNECPCLSCHPNNYYGACNYLLFQFDENDQLVTVLADPNTLGWE